MPTLLAAAGIAPDAAYPPDGIDLLPVLTQGAHRPPDTLLALQANAQRAVRDGDFKYLKILDTRFSSTSLRIPMERANLKERTARYLRSPGDAVVRVERHHAAGG